ncbi:MAG: hypothetical protein GEV06_21050 [Luteitalea sp.]|nr:hypothetical protein [Luteitalea sp.]
MRPAQLRREHFAAYPRLAKQLAIREIELLRQLPLSFLALLLRELKAYDWKFPAERREIDAQLTYLTSLSQERRGRVMRELAQLRLSSALEDMDWVGSPGEFSEQLSAHLWTTDQIASFRAAAVGFLDAVRAAVPPQPPEIRRLGISVVGRGTTQTSHPLFRKLRPHGAYFTHVSPKNGVRVLLDRVAARAKAHAIPFAHWYVDGGSAEEPSPAGVTMVSYDALEPVRASVVARLREMLQAGTGSEARRTALAHLGPEDVGLRNAAEAEQVVDHFKVSVLSQGSGTQFFSTTFVQWSARELLWRAQPLTLITRFAPRMTERSMNEALAGIPTVPVLDPQGALIDADMGAYYTWLNLKRLPGAAESSFLAWFEGHTEAVVVSPSLARGTQSNSAVTLEQLLDEMEG